MSQSSKWTGKQKHPQQQHPPKKRHKSKNHNKNCNYHKKKKGELNDEQVAAKCVSIETQLRIQRERAAATTSSLRQQDDESSSSTPLPQRSKPCPAYVKGFLYDQEKQRYFRASDKNVSKNVADCLPKAFNRCNVSLPPEVSQFSIVGFLRRQQLNHGSSISYSSIVARSMQLKNNGTIDSIIKCIHIHPLFGKLVTVEGSLLLLCADFDTLYLTYPTPCAALTFVTAKWAPVPTAVIGAVLCDSYSVFRVIVLTPRFDDHHDEDGAQGMRDMGGLSGGCLSSTVLKIRRNVSNIYWSTKEGTPCGGTSASGVTSSVRTIAALGQELELVVCSDDAVYIIVWPTCKVTRLCAVPSPAICFTPLHSTTLPPSPHSYSGLLGLRNGSILMTDTRIHSCSSSASSDSSDRSKHGHRKTPPSSSSLNPAPILLTRMQHCIDHLHTLQHTTSVIAQDVVGNVSLFDLRRASHPAVTIVTKSRAASSHMIQGSLFWVSPDEQLVLVNASIDQPHSQYHSRAIDVWSLTTPAQRFSQLPIPRQHVMLDEGAGGSSINVIRFAPNVDWEACLDGRSSSYGNSSSGRNAGGNSYGGGNGYGRYNLEDAWLGASVACLSSNILGRLDSTLFDVCGR